MTVGDIGADSVLIFLHIPKCAGTTLYPIIRRQYDQSKVFAIDGSDTYSSLNTFKKLSKSRRERLNCLMGHQPFGMHCYFSRPSKYFTFLRHPVDRILSHYYYVLQSSTHYLYEAVSSEGMTLLDYVESGITHELNDGQTKLIAGNEHAPPPDMLDVAKENIRQHFLFVGLTESFDESLVFLKRLMGWRWIYYKKKNVTSSRPSRHEIGQKIIDRIIENNKNDMLLYEFAVERFEEKLKGVPPSFSEEIRSFQFRNRILNVPWSLIPSFQSVKRLLRGMFR
jgi:hypothetical protein